MFSNKMNYYSNYCTVYVALGHYIITQDMITYTWFISYITLRMTLIKQFMLHHFPRECFHTAKHCLTTLNKHKHYTFMPIC